jgi:hypothetical protein
MAPDRAYRVLAAGLLAPYRLSPVERQEEIDSLAQVLQTAVEQHLENLEHRKA